MSLLSLNTLFKGLSDPKRLRIIHALFRHPELCACQITELLGISSATTSRHMDVLLASGLVISQKDGRWIHYRINSEHFSTKALIGWFDNISDDELLKSDSRCLVGILKKEMNHCDGSNKGKKA